MPDPNQNNQQPSVTPPVIFPHSDLPPLPPDFQNIPTTDTPPVSPTNQPANQTVTIDVNNGSSAPPDIPPMTSNPKKKFGGGKIIATILGLIVLVGGVGAGILLTQQPQLFQQKAGSDVPYCSQLPLGSDCSTSNITGATKCISYVNGDSNNPYDVYCCPSGQKISGSTCVNNYIQPSTVDCGLKPDGSVWNCNTDTQVCCNTGCVSKSVGCEAGNEPQGVVRCSNDSNTVAGCRDQLPGFEFCLNNTEMKCTGPGPNCGQDYNTSGSSCRPGGAVNCTNPINLCGGTICRKWMCPEGDTNNDGKCQTGDTGASYTDYPDCSNVSCGNACCQIDWLNSAGTDYCNNARNCKEINLICPPPSEPTPIPTPTPTPTPGAPSCIQVKAYDATWNVLTEDAQLSALTTGEVVKFCVDGMTNTGTFDKAQFMINTVLEAETTTVRPDSTDFCQSYTILSTDTTVSVKAKIHHATLGWVGENI